MQWTRPYKSLQTICKLFSGSRTLGHLKLEEAKVRFILFNGGVLLCNTHWANIFQYYTIIFWRFFPPILQNNECSHSVNDQCYPQTDIFMIFFLSTKSKGKCVLPLGAPYTHLQQNSITLWLHMEQHHVVANFKKKKKTHYTFI